MLLQELQAMGAFISDALVQKEIKFTLDDGVEHTATVFVKRLSMGEYEKVFASKDEKLGTSARVIAESIRLGKEGEERLTPELVYSMHQSIATALLGAFTEVNAGKKA